MPSILDLFRKRKASPLPGFASDLYGWTGDQSVDDSGNPLPSLPDDVSTPKSMVGPPAPRLSGSQDPALSSPPPGLPPGGNTAYKNTQDQISRALQPGQQQSSLPSSGGEDDPYAPIIQKITQDIMNSRTPPKQPSAWRQVLGGVAALAGGSNFTPLIEYGPKGLQQLQDYRRQQAELPQKVTLLDNLAKVRDAQSKERESKAYQQAVLQARIDNEARIAQDKAEADRTRFESRPGAGYALSDRPDVNTPVGAVPFGGGMLPPTPPPVGMPGVQPPAPAGAPQAAGGRPMLPPPPNIPMKAPVSTALPSQIQAAGIQTQLGPGVSRAPTPQADLKEGWMRTTTSPEQQLKNRQEVLHANDIEVPALTDALKLPPGTKINPDHIPAYATGVAALQNATNKSQGEIDADRDKIVTDLKKRGMPLDPRDEAVFRATGKIERPPVVNVNAADNRGDKSYALSTRQLDVMNKPIQEAANRIANLKASLDQNTPQADALVGPQLLTAMAGGQGTGLRMNESEIARIVGGRSKWQTLQAAIKQWSLDPKTANSITEEQRSQIRALVAEVDRRIQQQSAALEGAYGDLATTNDVDEHRQIITKARGAFNAAMSAGGQVTVTDPNGGVHTFPDEASAQVFRKQAGIK